MADGVSFAGNGGMDSTINKNGTEPPSAGTENKSGGVTFAGNGDTDVSGFSSNTKQHDPSMNSPDQGGKGVTFVSE